MEERLQKIIAKCGIASRRKAEELIMDGLVKVNGVKAEIGMKADLSRDHIKVNGKLISKVEPKVYLILNKPVYCITAMYDEEKRPTVKDFLQRVKTQVFPVGRLDYNSEGLLIVTNDGDLANAILHPRHKIPKTYRVKVNEVPDENDIKKLENGLRLDDGMTKPAKVRIVQRLKTNSWVDITIYEGKKRQVRRMFDRIGHSVIKLIRIRINGLQLTGLKPGEFRYLTNEEVDKLKQETGVI